VPRNDTRECNFVLGDDRGHQIDIHSYTFDSTGNLVFGVPYPYDSLNGTGAVNEFPVKCISPEWMVKFHTGYTLDENDYHDVQLLCQRFSIAIPSEYKKFEVKNMDTQLFQGKLICLAAPDPEFDAEIESKWTHNAEFARLMYAEPMRPLSPNIIKKKYAEANQATQNPPNEFRFAIRTQADDRLIGLLRFIRIDWSNSGARFLLGIVDENDRGKGYGTEAMQLALNYAFREMNLYRLSANVLESNSRALAFLRKHGFVDEVRRRQAVYRDGKYWDWVMLGLLRDEWSAK